MNSWDLLIDCPLNEHAQMLFVSIHHLFRAVVRAASTSCALDMLL